jgi:4-carboxymuconolactone decarboxylase
MSSRRFRQGMEEMRKHLGPQADVYVDRLTAISPEFAKVNVEFPFGELYRRDVLDDKTRELCTLAALTVQGFSLPELRIHTHAALNCGATRIEVIEVITQMIAYCGFPAATNALLCARDVFAELDEDAYSPATELGEKPE